MFRLSRYDHVSDALATLHWLRLPQRVDFKVAVMTFRVLHSLSPSYLNDVRVADLSGRRRLRSSSSHQLLVPPIIPAHNRRSTLISSRRIAPLELIATRHSIIPSLLVFRQRLKHAFLRLCGLRDSSAIPATLKIID